MAKSKAKAAAVLAACAATNSSSAAAAAPPLASLTSSAARGTAAGPLDLPHRESLPVQGIPRGGHAPPASAEAAEEGAAKAAMREGAKRRKKKKRSKQRSKAGAKEPQQRDATNVASDADATDAPSGDAPPSEGNDSSSSNSNPLPPAAQSILAQTCHYDVLGITKAATQAEIQKAYRRRCVLTHPDKLPNGDRSAFDKVSAAYDVLGCEKKRAVYDKFGHAGIEGDIDLDNLSKGAGFGGGFGGFGNDVFRDFFSAGTEHFFGRRSASPQPHPFRRAPLRNRDLRYQLEVSLEELYSGATKTVAIQQPNPVRPQYPLRKEVEVALTPGMAGGQSVRLSGVVDSVPDAAPADVVFLIRERRHRIFTRRGADLAVEVTISFAESVVGFRRTMLCLDGREIVIGSPSERTVVRREEAVEAPSLPLEHDAEEMPVENNTTTSANATVAEESAAPDQITKTTTLSYNLPPSIIRTGDVHVLRGRGMPKRGGASAHHNAHFGDLYVQYVVETPGASSESAANADNLSPEERVELARLLSKLEGSEDPTVDVIETGEGDDEANADQEKEAVQQLSVSSAAEFGRSSVADNDHDEHLRHDEDDARSGMPHGANDFFRQAFGGRSAGGFGGPFGLRGTGGGFRYFSSGGDAPGGFGYGQQGAGEEEDHTVQCNQM